MNFSQLLNESNYLFEDKIKDIFSKFSLGSKQKREMTDFISRVKNIDIQNSDIVEINASQFNSKGTKLGDEYAFVFSTVKDKAERDELDFVIIDFLGQEARFCDYLGRRIEIKPTAATKKIKDAEVKKIYGIKPTSNAALKSMRADAKYNSNARDYENGKLSAITNIDQNSYMSANRLRKEMLKKLKADKLFNNLFGELKSYFDEFNKLYSEFVSSGYDPFNKELISKLQKHVAKFDKFRGIGFGYDGNIFKYYGIDMSGDWFKVNFADTKSRYPDKSDEEIIAKFIENKISEFKFKLRD